MTSLPRDIFIRHALHASTHPRPTILNKTGVCQLFTSTLQLHPEASRNSSKMSWMDSWSRPSKSQPTPPPLYLTIGETVPYCHSCGRVIGERKKQAGQEVKYCSARCRNNKPRPIDRRIEAVFAALLDGATPGSLKDKESDIEGEDGPVGRSSRELHGRSSGKRKKAVKGDARIIAECATVEDIVFARDKDPAKVFGRRKNRAARGVVEEGEWKSVDMVDDPHVLTTQPAAPDTTSEKNQTLGLDSEDATGGVSLTEKDTEEPAYGFGGGKIRPPQAQSDINGSIGGEKGRAERIHETDEMKAKRKDGKRRAEEKEMVKRAARRGVAFGLSNGEEKRKCEAVMKGVVVESSFAKGEWGIRWREE
ncbi:hypothetical protein P171DRAFT_431876 [Karstenula rhodostoma CBS 690.94]|uniref:Uncharacterized protein n=1 Tax=Karstenula rhodostoma CBS 690.94 TaxID=1392251 RepID=A0A9P4PJ53_9PLEO|nr:hypothetical protein P171DRAFT_431876 [Karstenula rhodostoma CBS 690.94]